MLLEIMEVTNREYPDDLRTLFLYQESLVMVYYNMGRMNGVEELQTDILKGRQKLFGQKHPHTLTAMANIALTYMHQNRFEVRAIRNPNAVNTYSPLVLCSGR